MLNNSTSSGSSGLQRRPAGYVAAPVMTIGGDSRQPSEGRSTQVIVTFEMACEDDEDVIVVVEVSDDDSTWIEIASARVLPDVDGLAVNIVSTGRTPITFEIPPSWFYRFAKTGDGAASIVNHVEQEI